MTDSTKKIPYRISEYIKDHFKEDFLFTVKTIKNQKGEKLYKANVTKDNIIHHLTFSAEGNFIADEVEKAFPDEDER